MGEEHKSSEINVIVWGAYQDMLVAAANAAANARFIISGENQKNN
jgi:hypothetical protein